MTDKATDVTQADGGEYLIRKYGMYYRPNAQGYTGSVAEAGRYTLAEAIQHSHPNGPNGPRDDISYILAPPRTASEQPASGEVDLRRIVKGWLDWYRFATRDDDNEYLNGKGWDDAEALAETSMGKLAALSTTSEAPEAGRLRKALASFVRMEKSIMAAVHSAHQRGAGASEWMREDDRDMRADLRKAFDAARAALAHPAQATPSALSGGEAATLPADHPLARGLRTSQKALDAIARQEQANIAGYLALRDFPIGSALSGDAGEGRAPFACAYCGAPSWVDPSDQSPPLGYCHPDDHGAPGDAATPSQQGTEP